MPYVKRPGRSLILGLATLCATLGAAVAPGLAAAACPSAPTSKAFQRFGDLADYSIAPGGAFEGSAPGWTLNGAKVTSGNEGFKARNPTDAFSLSLPAGATAVSPAFCVSIANPTFRFFARRTSGSWGVLYATVRWTDSAGVTHDTTAGAQTGDLFTTWQPSSVLALGAMLPLWQAGSTLQARLVFTNEAYGGNWAIDDVFIDPYSR